MRTINGELSGMYAVGFPNRYGAARYRLEAPRDLSMFKAFSFKALSRVKDQEQPAAQSLTSVQVSITDGTTSFASTESFPLTREVQTFTTLLAPELFTRTVGQDEFEQVLGRVEQIGFVFTSKTPKSEPYVATIVFDDLELRGDPQPESDEPG